jgi:hypothetical protein
MPSVLDRLLDPGYLGDLRAHSLDQIRAMRAECQDVETGLSLLRRVVQGRLDIVGLELRRRADGGDPADLGELIGQLPDVLAQHTRSPGFGRPTTGMGPGTTDVALGAELDEIAGGAALAKLPALDDAALRDLADRLEAFERRVSGHRRELHDRIDRLQGEVIRRYREGEASVDALLRPD